ncbi:MAG: 23S rRNA (uracil(1939)-C(5))-methyltransferase RlmD, partial [Coriobacteriales bacterium]|nr:23S rRNA (uracil(1939)-C(5))-methyltransferase RlmD [Coriobacteriales bacterium]
MTEALYITSMSSLGSGIARTQDGKTVFVDGAVVGDSIEPHTVQCHERYDVCESYALLEPSPQRVVPPCPYAGVCGGCPWQVLAYEEQLRWKRQFVVDALERIGKVAGSRALVGECVPSPMQWHYRNKVELGAFTQKEGLCLGLHKRASKELTRIDACLLLPKPLATVPRKLAGTLTYSLRGAEQNLSRVAVRSSRNTGAVELELFMLPSGINRSLVFKTLKHNVKLSSLVRVIIAGKQAERKVKQVEVLSGAGYWQEELADNNYKVRAPSFFQTNSAVAEAMIAHLEALLDTLGLDASAHVADLYSGVGTFTLPLARRFNQVTAIEGSGSAIGDLRRNLAKAGLEAEVIGGDVARELPELAPVELAVVDPPRKGLKPEAVEALLECGTSHLVYVSC